ncbi:unnamed protein product, partial [Urochloa humidicola]
FGPSSPCRVLSSGAQAKRSVPLLLSGEFGPRGLVVVFASPSPASSGLPTMDEKEFRRMLELFPVVRSRDYCAEPGTSSRGTKQPLRIQEATKSNNKVSSGVEDLFMQKLKMAAEKKIGATKAEFFCKAFEEVHEKLVYKELNLDAAKKFLSAYES